MPKKNKLHSILIERIKTHGPMSVADYMAECLMHPKYGYYCHEKVFGKDGDFITAPEISQMFGEIIGAWVANVWLSYGRPSKMHLVELGPGRGTLMADMVRVFETVPGLLDSLSIHMVEMSASLRKKQEEALTGFDVTWHDTLLELPQDAPVVFVANEFFDALPIHQFQKYEDKWHERYIGLNDNDDFQFNLRPIKEGMDNAFLTAKESDIFETSPASIHIVRDISMRIKQYGGAALIIDYGHREQGAGDTLQAVYKHEFAEVFERPGKADITAHVDFETLSLTAKECDIHASEIMTQGDFLNALGIWQRAAHLMESANDKQKTDIQTALHRLTSPDEMGELFKVLSLTASA